MPYVSQEQRTANEIVDEGTLNYFITKVILDVWSKAPKYATIHMLRKELVTDPKNSRFIKELRGKAAHAFTVADIHTAAALAFNEFYRRVGVTYEESKIKANGDLPEYEAVLKAITEPKAEEVKA